MEASYQTKFRLAKAGRIADYLKRVPITADEAESVMDREAWIIAAHGAGGWTSISDDTKAVVVAILRAMEAERIEHDDSPLVGLS